MNTKDNVDTPETPIKNNLQLDSKPSSHGTNMAHHNLVFGLMGLLALLVACSGVFIWQHQEVTNLNAKVSSLTASLKTANAQLQSVHKVSNTTTTPSTTNKTQTSATWLTIKELGIKVPLSYRISDMQYAIEKTSSGTGIQFSTNTLANDGCTLAEYPLGTVAVFTKPSTNPGLGDSQDGQFLSSLNGYYLYYHTPQSPCGNSAGAAQLEIDQSYALVQALTDAQSSN